ncbi:MAG: cupin domain-containing protein [Micrococcales bacterium]|nr:cupin domain-containing protein [Micrococcales bacterium]
MSTINPAYRNGDGGPAYLIQGPSADIGVLHLTPGQAMPNHFHARCDETFVVLEGRAGLWLDGSIRYDLTPDTVLACEPGELHYLVNDSHADFRCVFIKSPASPGDTVNVPWEPGKPAPGTPT